MSDDDRFVALADLAATLERASMLVRDLAAGGAFSADEAGVMARSITGAALVARAAVLRLPVTPIH
jgi:hypothetical protein